MKEINKKKNEKYYLHDERKNICVWEKEREKEKATKSKRMKKEESVRERKRERERERDMPPKK